MNRLKEKVALVSGAARGIGEAIARAFVSEGVFVFLVQGRSMLDDNVSHCHVSASHIGTMSDITGTRTFHPSGALRVNLSMNYKHYAPTERPKGILRRLLSPVRGDLFLDRKKTRSSVRSEM